MNELSKAAAILGRKGAQVTNEKYPPEVRKKWSAMGGAKRKGKKYPRKKPVEKAHLTIADANLQ